MSVFNIKTLGTNLAAAITLDFTVSAVLTAFPIIPLLKAQKAKYWDNSTEPAQEDNSTEPRQEDNSIETTQGSSFQYAITKGLSIFSQIVPGAFFAYTLRGHFRDELKHPWLGGFIGGAIKYLCKGGYLSAGSYNNFAYELGKDYSAKVSANTQFFIIEGLESAVLEGYKGYNNNSTSPASEVGNGILYGLGEGLAVGGLLLASQYAFLNPFISFLETNNRFNSLPFKVITGLSSVAATGLAIYQLDNQINNKLQNESSLISNMKNKVIKATETTYEWIVDPLVHGPYKFLSQLYERPTQAKESFSLTASKFLNNEISPSLNKISSWFSDYKFDFTYVKPIKEEEVAINIGIKDVKEYHLYTSKGTTAIKGVEVVKNSILHGDEDNRFGEFSGLTVDNDGNLIFVSDRGSFVKTTPTYQNGVITELNKSVIGTIHEGGLKLSEQLQDIEEVVFYNGDCVVSHETINDFSVYKGCDFSSGNRSSFAFPDDIKNLPHNKGIEAFGISKQGVVLAISEYGENIYDKKGGKHIAFSWKLSSEFDQVKDLVKFHYQSTPGYGVSGMTFLSNGSVLVLERKYEHNKIMFGENYWIKLKLIRASALKDIPNDTVIEGTNLLEINPSSPYEAPSRYSYADNFEAITALENLVDGKTVVLMATDSNRAPFSQDFLLQVNIDNYILGLDH